MDIQQIVMPLVRSRGWITFLAIVAFLNAAIQVISSFGIGIIVAWLPIWIGVLLIQASSAIGRYELNLTEDDLQEGMEKLAMAFKVTSVWVIVTIALVILVFVFFFSAIMMLVGANV